MLRRLGNKSKMIDILTSHFPEQVTTFIDLFAGTCSVSFAMLPRCKYVICNDNDAEVFNFFFVLKEKEDEFRRAVKMLPTHSELFSYWKKHQEVNEVWRAVRFFYLSNLAFCGKQTAPMKINMMGNDKRVSLSHLDETIERIHAVSAFMCEDFRDVLKKIALRHLDFGRPANDKERAFIYADPPYIGTDHNYKTGFRQKDTIDLFDVLKHSGMRYAISEFESPFILELAKTYKLYVSPVCERRTIGNRNTEILLTSYEPVHWQMPLFKERKLAA